MIKLSIPDMSCGHCAGVITQTLQRLDAAASVSFDLPAHRAEVSTKSAPEAVLAALAAAGYPATVAG